LESGNSRLPFFSNKQEYRIESANSWLITVNMAAAPTFGAVADVCEYCGICTSDSLDKTTTCSYNGNPGSTISTGTTDLTAQATELWIGATFGSYTQSAPQNNFNLMDGNGGATRSLGMLQKIVAQSGQAGSSVTQSGSSFYLGCIAAFKGTSS
jgi:hypothetical protein